MEGRKGCYSGGGKVRDIGGIKAPAYGSNPKLVAEAKKQSTGSRPMDGPAGGPAKSRLDRKRGGKC